MRQALEVRSEDRNPQKWSVSLREDVFDSFFTRVGSSAKRVFSEGSLFSPLLFGKFFDPSDAFPLWDFDSESLLSRPQSSTGSTVDWFTTEAEYVLRAKLPEMKNHDVQIYVDSGKVVEISGQWRRGESEAKDWRTGRWWEFGYVRRLELPENAKWRKMEADIDAEHYLEIRIPKNTLDPNIPEEKKVEPKDSEFALKE
ncbi:21.7 kDa class VI heat shock protein-like [Aristolochia californica]|uniref:21.7 kDa class VI heat shock protein-like n=1 Tax=Aristolochia californica TaxID=171875 RepID=UPI0035D83588